jgi:hypothetical protein
VGRFEKSGARSQKSVHFKLKRKSKMTNREILENLLMPLTKKYTPEEAEFFQTRLDKYFEQTEGTEIAEKIKTPETNSMTNDGEA